MNKQKKRLLISSLVSVLLLLLLLYVLQSQKSPTTSLSEQFLSEGKYAPASILNTTPTVFEALQETIGSQDTGAVLEDGKKTYVDTNTDTPEDTDMHADRTTYQEGFYYEPINDSVKERINGLSYKEDCTVPYEDLRYVSVTYYDFYDEIQTGEIICNQAIAQDLVEIFYELYQNAYQIDQIRLVDDFNADDDLSCAADNTSCFNFRTVYGTNTISKHGLGLAIDINPFYNPYVTYPNGVERISPPGSEPYADRNSNFPHKIDENDLCYQLFTAHGFTWGGNWNSLKDYQHFQKEL